MQAADLIGWVNQIAAPQFAQRRYDDVRFSEEGLVVTIPESKTEGDRGNLLMSSNATSSTLLLHVSPQVSAEKTDLYHGLLASEGSSVLWCGDF
jgi:hypothetical protein